MYTMNRSQEQADTAGPRKEVAALPREPRVRDRAAYAILGLEESLRDDLKLIRFFGLAGNQKRADVLFSKSAPDAPPHSRTTSTSHGGFDDDVPTMNSVMRRILAAEDSTAIVEAPLPGAAGTHACTFPGRGADPESAPVTLEPVAAAQPDAERAAPGRHPARHALCVGIDMVRCAQSSSVAASTTRAAGRRHSRSAAFRSPRCTTNRRPVRRSSRRSPEW